MTWLELTILTCLTINCAIDNQTIKRLRRDLNQLYGTVSKETSKRVSHSFSLNHLTQKYESLELRYGSLANRYTNLRRDNFRMKADLLKSGIFVTDVPSWDKK